MKLFINYLKYSSLFLIIELFLTFIMSILNLLGVTSGITTLLIFIFNILLFFILNIYNAKSKMKNGYLEGLLLGIIYIILMAIIKLLFFNNIFNISTIIYYLILLLISIIGGMFGINKRSNK